MGYPFPTGGSVLGAAGSVPSSCKAAVWLQIVAGMTVPGASALVYDDSTSTAGRQVARLAAPACQMGPMIGPFISTCEIYVGNLTGGSVNIWVRPTNRR